MAFTKASSELLGTPKFGWIPDVPDKRDIPFKAAVTDLTALPKSVDISSLTGPVLNQGSLGSCTAFATLAAYYASRRVRTAIRTTTSTSFSLAPSPRDVPLDSSELFQYYQTRVLENRVKIDSGATIRSSIKSLNKFGVCTEALHKYSVTAFARPPTAQALAEATQYRALRYERIDNRVGSQLYSAVAKGHVVVFGSMLYQSCTEAGQTGLVKMPKKSETALGGHAMAIVGYNMGRKLFMVKNSWGTNWGQSGYCWMPEAYLTDTSLSDDFWVLK